MLFIARRYLFSSKSHSVVNIICCVSLVSLLIPVAAIIVLLSVFNGFAQMIGQMNRAVEGDLTIEARSGHLFDQSLIDTERIGSLSGVEGLSFATEQLVLLRNAEYSLVARLRGVDENYGAVVEVGEMVDVGSFQLFDGAEDRIVIGGSMIGPLGIRGLAGNSIEVVSLKSGALQSLLSMWQYSSERASLGGIVQLNEQSETSMAYTSQRLVESLLGEEGIASRVMLRLDPASDHKRLQNEVQSVVGDGFSVKSRAQLDPTTYNIVRYEKLGVGLISMLVMILASFSLLGALTMLIIEKRGDVATLRAIGASQGDIRRIFLLEGGLISGIAIVLGVAVGCALTLVQQHFGIIELPSRSMVVNYYPVALQMGDVAWVVAIAVAIAATISTLTVHSMSESKKQRY